MTAPASPAESAANSPAKPEPWQPRATDIKASVAKYSRFVSTMKILLPSVAVLLLALVLILPQLRDEPDQFSADIVPARQGAGGALSLVNARYFGTDDSGQQFSVTADSVVEGSGDDKQISLVAPQADISLNDGTWLVVGADQGQYDRDLKVLELEGNVNLFQDQGYEMHTGAATVRLDEGRATSTVAVRSQGPFGTLESEGFDLEDKGKVVHFTGPARLVLNAGSGSSGTP